MDKLSHFEMPVISGEYITAHEAVYHRLRNALMVGAIKPGTAMRIRALAQYLGHSPTPVREALRRLSSENALQVLDNRRIIVPLINAGQFEELILLRVKLECLAAERALPYVSQILIDHMITIDTQMDRAVSKKSFDALSVLNQEFHTVLYTANPNQTVMPLVESVWLQLGPFQRQMMNKTLSYYVVDHHKHIINALTQRDTKGLCNAIAADICEGVGRAGKEVFASQSEQCA